MDQALKICVAQTHRLRIGPSREDHLLLFCQMLLHVDWDAIQIAKGGHRPDGTVCKGGSKLCLMGQADLLSPQKIPYLAQVCPIGGRKHQCDHLVVCPGDNCFRHHLARNVLTFCNLLGTKGSSMLLDLERHLMLTQVSLESLFALHRVTSSVAHSSERRVK